MEQLKALISHREYCKVFISELSTGPKNNILLHEEDEPCWRKWRRDPFGKIIYFLREEAWQKTCSMYVKFGARAQHPHSVKLRSVIGWSPPYLEFNAQHEVKIILELVAAHM